MSQSIGSPITPHVPSLTPSFLGNDATITREPISLSAHLPHDQALLRIPQPDKEILVELRDANLRRCRLVTTVPAKFLHVYAEDLSIVEEPATRTWKTQICIPSWEHVDDIEVPALCWLFEHMSNIIDNKQLWNCLPEYDSIGQGVILYRGLQLLNLYDAAEMLRPHLLKDVHLKALTASDVQRLWWTFQFTEEWDVWLEAILRNLAYFKLYEHPTEGDQIELFIEGEIHLLTQAEQNLILDIYHSYQEAFKPDLANKKTCVKRAVETASVRLRELRHGSPPSTPPSPLPPMAIYVDKRYTID